VPQYDADFINGGDYAGHAGRTSKGASWDCGNVRDHGDQNWTSPHADYETAWADAR
jgi:hypothetical protein